MRVGGKLTSRRAVGAECATCIGGAAVAIFALGATPLPVLLVLACVLSMAPALVVGGTMRREGGSGE